MPSILIVDDDPTIRGMFARALKSLGDIEQAESGTDALRLLASKKYSVVLLDLHMPVVDGFVVLQTLATKQGPNGDTPVYLITADTSDEARIRALRRHAVFFLTKPVPIATLVSLVDSTLRMVDKRAQATSAKAASAGEGAGGRSSFNPRPTPLRPASSPSDRPSYAARLTPPPPPAMAERAPAMRATPTPPRPPSRIGVDTPVPESPWPPPESPRPRPKKG